MLSQETGEMSDVDFRSRSVSQESHDFVTGDHDLSCISD